MPQPAHLMDYDVQRCTRRCAVSGRELAEGEWFYSVLMPEGAGIRRLDYAAETWQGPPPEALGWWKSRIPTREAKKGRLAPNEVLLSYFQQIEGRPDQAEVLYVLALLLVRRRVLKLEDTVEDAEHQEMLVLYCPREEATYRVTAVVPTEERAAEIQTQLQQLLFADAT